MPLPTTQDLQNQQQDTEEKIKRLQAAYDSFLADWEKVEREEQKMAEKLRQVIDKSKMHDILDTIHSIKE